MSELDVNQAVSVLNRLFVWKYNSLARYIVDARPYVTPGEESSLQIIQHQAACDQGFAEDTALLLERLGAIPRVEPYEEFVSDLNYLSLAYLITILREKLQQQLECIDNIITSTHLPSSAAVHMVKAQKLWSEQLAELDTLRS